MNVFSVLGSFSRATQGNEEIILNDDQSETTNTGSSGYFSPGMEHSVLAPYNYSFS